MKRTLHYFLPAPQYFSLASGCCVPPCIGSGLTCVCLLLRMQYILEMALQPWERHPPPPLGLLRTTCPFPGASSVWPRRGGSPADGSGPRPHCSSRSRDECPAVTVEHVGGTCPAGVPWGCPQPRSSDSNTKKTFEAFG